MMKVDDSMSFATILTSLDNLEKLHSSLLQLAYDKTALIKEGNMEALDQILKDEQAHLAAIAQLDAQREVAVKAYLTEKGKHLSMHPTVSDVIEVATDAAQTQLKEARDRLLHVIHELKWQNDLNQQLTYQSLQFVNLSLDMVKPQSESVTYSKQEVTGSYVSKRSTTFDTNA